MLLQPQSIDTGMSPLEIAKDGYKGGRMDSEKYNKTVKLLESAQSGQSINQSMDNKHLLKSSHARSIKMRVSFFSWSQDSSWHYMRGKRLAKIGPFTSASTPPSTRR